MFIIIIIYKLKLRYIMFGVMSQYNIFSDLKSKWIEKYRFLWRYFKDNTFINYIWYIIIKHLF